MTPHPRQTWPALLGFLVASYAVAALGALSSASNVPGWYAAAAKPGFTPPNWLFGPMWTVLYGLMAVAAWLVWRERGAAPAAASAGLRLWWVQLALNLAWTPVFFALQWLWPALVVIVLLDLAVLATLLRFRQASRPAAWLLVPYLAWICYATALNAGVAWLN